MENRRQAMVWWMHLADTTKQDLTDLYYEGRSHESLTGREIEKIWAGKTP